jgi:hypothetical protein
MVDGEVYTVTAGRFNVGQPGHQIGLRATLRPKEPKMIIVRRNSCPISGKIVVEYPRCGHDVSMTEPDAIDEIVAYLTQSCPLSSAEAARVVADVLGYFSEAPEEFVRRRHRELKGRGLTNDQAFGQIAAEIPRRRYVAPEFSLRQLRRIVYG